MERFVETKIARIQEIKTKYLPQIRELEEQDSPITNQIIENLKSDMASEIDAVVKELENEKKQQVEELKRKSFMR
jgi:hypothetical protein